MSEITTETLRAMFIIAIIVLIIYLFLINNLNKQ